MPVRDVTIRATSHEMVGDETVELWLKRGAGAWALEQSVPVDTSTPPYQSFLVLGLESGLNHVAQIRVFRDGRYRAGYIGGDPEAWPIQSRIEFVPGAEAAPAPTIVSGEFERTSGVAHEVRLTVTPHPDALALDLDLLDGDGEVVDTIAGPHVGDVVMTHHNPPIATAIFYTARHRQFTLNGVESDPFRQWIGPVAPTDLVQVAELDDYYAYHIDWTNNGGSTRIRDDWPTAGFINRVLEGSGTSHRDQTVEKESELDEGSDEQLTTCTVEIRHEVGAFAVTDVSEWVGIDVSITMHTDETAHPGAIDPG